MFVCVFGWLVIVGLVSFRSVSFEGTWTQAYRLGEKIFVVGRPFQKTRGYTRDGLVSVNFEAVKETLSTQG